VTDNDDLASPPDDQDPLLSAQRQKQGAVIGKVLRKQFEVILTEPVPQDLIALLDELERREVET
jgi:hypothetical protein